MASILNFLLKFLPKLRFTRRSIYHCIKRWALFLAFLGRRLGVKHLWHDGKRGTSHKPAQAERSSSGSGARLELGEYVVAASQIPASASHPNLPDVPSATGQLQITSSSRASPTASLTVEPHRGHAHRTTALAAIHSDSSSTGLGTDSRARDRLSIIQTHSRRSFHAPVGQTTRFPGAPDRPSRSPSPTSRVHQLPHFEIDTTNLHPQTHVDDGNSPITPYSVASQALSSSTLHGHRRRQSSASVVVGVANPSTGLPLSSSTNQPRLTEEPYTIGLPIEPSSSVAGAPDAREVSPQHSPTASSPAATSNFGLPASRFLQLINSEQVPRYTREVLVPRERYYYEIPPLTTTFLYVSEQIGPELGSIKEDSAPWVPATHPDGALYFYDRDRRLFTDTDMQDPVLREELEDFYHCLQRILLHDGVVIPSRNYDLTLDIMPSDDGRIQWSYYYACHDTRCLFWLDTYDATHMISELFGVKSPAHVRHRLEALYWTHWSLFPVVFDDRRVVPAVYDELVGILSYGSIDMMTSKSSTFPYDADTMQKLIELVRGAKGSDTGLVYHTAGITRMLSFFAHWRFLYFHGQNSARLERHKSLHTKADRHRTSLITFLSPVLFLVPEEYLLDLEKLWTDEVIVETVWRAFMTGVLDDWQQVILLSTVMLAANVGFLAIPGVIISNINSNISSPSQVTIFTSPSQIVSCMSMVASIGSIVIGMLLIRFNRGKPRENPAGASTYFYQNFHRIFGLEVMAINFSLPWALLMWAMVMFSIALLLFCFSISSTRIFVAVTAVMMAALIGWYFYSTWESSEGGMWASILRYIMRALNRGRLIDIFSLILRRENPPSHPGGHSGSLQVIPDRGRVDV